MEERESNLFTHLALSALVYSVGLIALYNGLALAALKLGFGAK
jgi:hypothetical protein